MCFINDAKQLQRLRERKQTVKVWKRGPVEKKTGLVVTKYGGFPMILTVVRPLILTMWKQGTVVRPHRIRKPLKDKQACTAGLYFYTDQPSKDQHNSKIVIATVKPEDIIAVSSCGTTICCTAATVIKAPNPDQRLKRITFLNGRIKDARDEIAVSDQQANEWAEQRRDQMECLQSMRNELKELKEKS